MRRFFERHPAIPTATFRVALLFIPLLAGWKSTTIGQDVNFDYFNYHSYDGWAFLQGRTFSDIFPGGSQTLVNPLIDVPTYLLQAHLGPKTAAFVIGFEQGLGPLLIALIVNKMTRSRLLALIAAATSAIAGGFAAELGNDMGDSIVAPFLLLGVFLAMLAIERDSRRSELARENDSDEVAAEDHSRRGITRRLPWWWVASGVAGGLGAGLKFAELPIAVGMVVACGLLVQRPAARLRTFVANAVGTLIGVAATAGYWTIALWRHYGDPIAFVGGNFLGFPDPIFPSSSASPGPAAAQSLASVFHFIVTPFDFYFHPTMFAELPVREASLAFGAAALFLVIGLYVVRSVVAGGAAVREHTITQWFWKARLYSAEERVRASSDRYLIVLFVVALYVWNRNFGVYRYLIPLELLGPAVLIALGRRLASLVRVPRRRDLFATRFLVPIFIAVCVVCMWTESPSAYWDRVPFGPTWASVATPKMLENGKLNALVGVGSPSYPASFVLPLLKGRFIAIGGVNGDSSTNMLTPRTTKLLDAAFATVRRDGGSVIGYWRNTASPQGPETIINALDSQQMTPKRCVTEIMGLGSSAQLFVFCRFVPIRHR